MIAASKNGHVEVVRHLLSAGADIESQNNTGSTSLARASRNGKMEVVEVLNAHRADVNAQNKKGYTPLMWASIMGYVEVVDELLKVKPDGNIKNENGDTALIAASRAGRIEIVKKLIGFGVDTEIHNQKGNTAFIEADSQEIQQLIEQGGRKVNVAHDFNRNERSAADHRGNFLNFFTNPLRLVPIAASFTALALVANFEWRNQKNQNELAEKIELISNENKKVKQCISQLKIKLKDKSHRIPADTCQ